MNSSRKKIIFVFLLFIYASCASQYSNVEETSNYAMLYGLIDTIIISIIMMIIPFIMRLNNKNNFEYEKGKKICKYNSIILFIISLILKFTFEDYAFIGGIGAVFYYYINLAIFTLDKDEKPKKKQNNKNSKKKKTSYCKYCGGKLTNTSVCPKCGKELFNFSNTIFFIILGILIFVFLLYFISENKNKTNNVIPTIGKNYYCPDGYELKNKSCYKTDITPAIIEYYCYSGSLVGTQCVTETYYPVSTKDNCPSGYSIFGFKCRKMGTSTNYEKCGSFDMTYSYLTNMCYQEIYPVETKYCNVGELYANQCIVKNYIAADYDYTCPSGYTLSNSTCKKEISISAFER